MPGTGRVLFAVAAPAGVFLGAALVDRRTGHGGPAPDERAPAPDGGVRGRARRTRRAVRRTRHQRLVVAADRRRRRDGRRAAADGAARHRAVPGEHRGVARWPADRVDRGRVEQQHLGHRRRGAVRGRRAPRRSCLRPTSAGAPRIPRSPRTGASRSWAIAATPATRSSSWSRAGRRASSRPTRAITSARSGCAARTRWRCWPTTATAWAGGGSSRGPVASSACSC